MLKLMYAILTAQGWSAREMLFTEGEVETAKEMARSMRGKPGYADVALYDFRTPKTRKRINVMTGPCTGVVAKTVLATVPACEVISLVEAAAKKAPKAKARKVLATAKEFAPKGWATVEA